MCGDETDARETEARTGVAFEFESYFDRDSGLWSLRRIPTSLPPKALEDSEST